MNGQQRLSSAFPVPAKPYLQIIQLTREIGCRLEQSIAAELGAHNIALHPSQAMMLYCLGDREVTSKELRDRRYYLGTNVTYNQKKLDSLGYVTTRCGDNDKRNTMVKATGRGLAVGDVVKALFDRQADTIELLGDIAPEGLETFTASLGRLHKFIVEQVMSWQAAS